MRTRADIHDVSSGPSGQLKKLAYCGHEREMTPEQRIAHELMTPLRKLVNECDEFNERCSDCRNWLQQLETAFQLGQQAAPAPSVKDIDVEQMRENLHATFSGGHHGNQAALEAFHHGMDTVCNVLAAYQKSESTNMILPAPPGREER